MQNKNKFHVNLSSLLRGNIGDIKKVTINDVELSTHNQTFNNIIANINFIRIDKSIIARGEITAKTKIICSRWNIRFRRSSITRIQLQYQVSWYLMC